LREEIKDRVDSSLRENVTRIRALEVENDQQVMDIKLILSI